jgi:hypothetical protein
MASEVIIHPSSESILPLKFGSKIGVSKRACFLAKQELAEGIQKIFTIPHQL